MNFFIKLLIMNLCVVSVTSADSYDPSTRILRIDQITVDRNTFYNVVIRLNDFNVISVDQPTTTPPPSSQSTITWKVADRCNDGYRVNYKFFDRTNNLVWPSSNEYYYTSYHNQEYTHNLSCEQGTQICLGGETGNSYWGVGLDNSSGCSSCCGTCDGGTYQYGFGC